MKILCLNLIKIKINHQNGCRLSIQLSKFIELSNIISKMNLIVQWITIWKIYFVKKWTLKFDLSHFSVLVLNQSPISAVFIIVRFPFAPKSELSGYSLYKCLNWIRFLKLPTFQMSFLKNRSLWRCDMYVPVFTL